MARFLPPFSPIFNPIEKLFGAVKQYFKSYRSVVSNMMGPLAMTFALESVTAEKCAACGMLQYVHLAITSG